MPKLRILPAAAVNGVYASLDAPGRAARVRGQCGAAVDAIAPSVWNGEGTPPVGWTLPVGLLAESNGARIAIVAADAFASGRPEFASAVDQLPGDWA